MKLRFANAPVGDLRLKVVGRGFVQPSHPEVAVTVRVNGEMVAVWRMTNGDIEQYFATIPARLIPKKQCEIKLEVANPASPKATGLSDDERQLGMGVRSMSFHPAPGTTA